MSRQFHPLLALLSPNNLFGKSHSTPAIAERRIIPRDSVISAPAQRTSKGFRHTQSRKQMHNSRSHWLSDFFVKMIEYKNLKLFIAVVLPRKIYSSIFFLYSVRLSPCPLNRRYVSPHPQYILQEPTPNFWSHWNPSHCLQP